MADNRALAEQFLREYKRTPEMGNWDTVIELGKTLAEAVLADLFAPREAQPGQIYAQAPTSPDKMYAYTPKGVGKEEYVTAVGSLLAGIASLNVQPNDAEKALALAGSFKMAVSAICVRTGCTNQDGRKAIQFVVDSAKKATDLVPNNDEQLLVHAGKFVQAVKALCQRKGCSIQEAKVALEHYK